MIDYRTLKHSDNGMPTWVAFLGPVLQVASTKREWIGKELDQAVLDEVDLPEELANLRYASKYHDLIAYNRVGWALSELKLSGLLNSPKRSIYRISETGKEALAKYGLNITRDFVHSQPAYIEHQNKLKNKKEIDNDITEDQTFELTEKQIKDWFDKQSSDLSEQLIAKLRSTDPYQFEHMMVRLLNEMGYKGTNGQSVVTQKSNDGGIDGIINQDPLGLRTVYVQVKRYSEKNIVGSPEINSFFWCT